MLAPVGRYPSAGLQHLVLASGLWESAARHRRHARRRARRRDRARARRRDVSCPARRIARRWSPATAGRRRPISVSQQVGANMLDRAAGRRGALWRARTSRCPPGSRLTKTYDLAEFVAAGDRQRARRDPHRRLPRRARAACCSCATGGSRSWRRCTLPLTVLATFFLMRLFGESINLMSMGGLAVAIGLVIDDAVVVVENIASALRRRRRRRGARRGDGGDDRRRSSARR